MGTERSSSLVRVTKKWTIHQFFFKGDLTIECLPSVEAFAAHSQMCPTLILSTTLTVIVTLT
jgi:hypothetical protein